MIRQNTGTFLLIILVTWSALPTGERSANAGLVLSQSAPSMPVASALPVASSAPVISLRAASADTIRFKTQNGESLDGIAPQTLEVPHLVLYRNGVLTGPEERTLIVEVSGIQVPAAGITVTLELETQHLNPDTRRGLRRRIPVWSESLSIANTSGVTQTGVTVVFTHLFTETVAADQGRIAIPTDYFRYGITLTDAGHPDKEPLHTLVGDQAFLLENQWIVGLPDVREESEGAAPDALVVYYCDMFPFRKNRFDPTTWLPREDVADYVRGELIPAMVEAYRIQTEEWGFPWYEAWTSYRIGDDLERLSVALTTRGTWFHGMAPRRALSSISINVTGGDNAAFESLTDGLVSSFHHELFHNLQRNINLDKGGDGNVGGRGGAWDLFSEGMAVFASSVGQSAVQFTQTSAERTYFFLANRYVAGSQILDDDLNTSYADLDPYHVAIYWRFLYEQCGGMADGVEYPAAGMEVIRALLDALYSQETVDIMTSTDLVGAMPVIIDQALGGSACPFQSYEESLTAFARAIYALRLEGGRCAAPGVPQGCGFYDPENLYSTPQGMTAFYDGADQSLSAGIPSSYGIDFVDVVLNPAADGQALIIEFYGTPEADAEFSLQLWKLKNPGDGAGLPHRGSSFAAPEALTPVDGDGRLVYVIPAIDTVEYGRLGLIITRLDSNEGADAGGAYTIRLHTGRAAGSE